MSTNTVRLHRVLRASPEKIYRAFLDPDPMVKWLPPHGFTGTACYLGWQESITLLAQLVEPEIPG
jgi:uncharacterized protein YndB with AHSA1/START domain